MKSLIYNYKAMPERENSEGSTAYHIANYYLLDPRIRFAAKGEFSGETGDKGYLLGDLR
jgi:hypothetical protein